MARPVHPPLVFGQSGLGNDDLVRIWTLANIDIAASSTWQSSTSPWVLTIALNGNEIPEQLPPELVPPSSRDLSASVDLVHIFKNNT
ncbi:hypothetical protein B0H11DRAFT_2091374, partial [Mycena galericulata]